MFVFGRPVTCIDMNLSSRGLGGNRNLTLLLMQFSARTRIAKNKHAVNRAIIFFTTISKKRNKSLSLSNTIKNKYDTCHHSGKNLLRTHSAAPRESPTF